MSNTKDHPLFPERGMYGLEENFTMPTKEELAEIIREYSSDEVQTELRMMKGAGMFSVHDALTDTPRLVWAVWELLGKTEKKEG